MPEKPQIELADIQQESEKKSEGLEIARTPELEKVIDKANELSEAIQQDRNVTGKQFLDLDKSLDGLKLDVCGEQMEVAEIKEIPDFKHNYEIWKSILRGDISSHDKITFIIPVVTRELVKICNEKNKKVTKKEDVQKIQLSHIRELSLDVAKELKNFKGSLFLNGLSKIPDDIMLELSRSKCGALQLGITDISDQQAEYFLLFPGWIILNNIQSLSDHAARFLGARSHPTILKNLRNVSDDALVKYLNGSTTLLSPEMKSRLDNLKK